MLISLRKFAITLPLCVLFAACSACDLLPGQPSGSALINQAESPVMPKIVVQLGHQAPVEAVRWLNGGKNLVSVASDGSLVFWDVPSGAIIDQAQVPANWNLGPSDNLFLQEFSIRPDGKTAALVFYEGIKVNEDEGDACPTEMERPSDAGRGTIWCTFSVDLETRIVTPDKEIPLPQQVREFTGKEAFPTSPDGTLMPGPNHEDGVAGLFDGSDEHIQFDEASCTSRQRCRYGVNLYSTDQKEKKIALTGNPRSYFLDADLSEDGRRMVRVEGLRNDTRARVEVLDLYNGSGQAAYSPERAYHKVRWLDADNYALSSAGYNATNDVGDAFPPVLIINPACATSGDCKIIPSYGEMEPFVEVGSFLGVGSLEGCYRWYGTHSFCISDTISQVGHSSLPPATGISIYSGPDQWRLMQQPDWNGQVITAIKLSPNAKELAVATRQWDENSGLDAKQTLRVFLFDVDGDTLVGPPREVARIVDRLADTKDSVGFYDANGRRRRDVSAEEAFEKGALGFDDEGTIQKLEFTPDGSKIVFTQTIPKFTKNANLFVADSSGSEPVKKFPELSRNIVAVGNGLVFGLDSREFIDIASGKTVAKADGTVPLQKGGYNQKTGLLWAVTEDGAVEFWDSENFSKQLTLYTFPENRFFAVTPGGRYDTNLGPDTNLIRWLVPDAPWQGLSSQTFMRDFYEPGLYRKLLDCREADTCEDVFKQLPSVASLNRVLPEVRIIGAKPGKDASEAIVSVEVQQGEDPSAANGKTRSGAYNLRLFRNGRVVDMAPNRPDAISDTREKWRQLNDVGDNANPSAPKRYDFTVPLPTGAGTERQEFSAYAFNEDRIKSATATFTYDRPPVAPRQPRAFVVAIGIDAYDTPRFQLNYAVADARLIAERLVDIPGYDMRRVTLAGERKADGSPVPIDNAAIRHVLSLITTNEGRAEAIRALRDEQGIDASVLEQATPDDIVIISFSGHGWADAQGNFYLIPTGGIWEDGSDTPERSSFFATADLARYFLAMQAAEITFIIDACHSAASVASGQFKPGPMGDSGLGQLAFDKGIRILAATQSDDVALEDARLKQGLLTYALVGEGLTQTGGQADLDGDRRIVLEEWLGYAVERLPSLSEDARLGQLTPAAGSGTREIIFNDLPENSPKRRVQKPSLFDFNTAASTVILRKDVR